MYLTATNLVYYLINHGLIDADSVVDGDFLIFEVGRRNRNFKVLRGEKDGLFVKQINNSQSWEPILTLQREAAFYELIRSRPELSPIVDIAPRLINHNPRNCSLVVDLVKQGENLTEHHQRVGTFPAHIGESVGKTLARYQLASLAVARESPGSSIFPRQPPWIFRLDSTGGQVLTQVGAPGTTFSHLLQQFPALLASLLDLKHEWRFDSLIHGDMKWDNLLISPGRDGQPEVRVVDWELTDIGDASWDVGSVFASYLIYWLLAEPASSAGWNAQTGDKFASMRRAMGDFWQSYAKALYLPAAVASEYLWRCLRFAAARIALAVFECLYNGQPASPALAGMLQTSQNIFLNPPQAASDLLAFDTIR